MGRITPPRGRGRSTGSSGGDKTGGLGRPGPGKSGPRKPGAGKSKGGRPSPGGRVGRPAAPQGLGARQEAARLIAGVTDKGATFDTLLANAPGSLPGRDRALAHMIATTTLRRWGEIDAVLSECLQKGLSGRAAGVRPVLATAAAQLLFMKVPDHAAVDLAVRMVGGDPEIRPFKALANGVLRRITREGIALAGDIDPVTANTPDWLLERWNKAFGPERARSIAAIHMEPPSLDLSVKSDPAGWAERLGGHALPTGTVRLAVGGRVNDLDGYDAGEWWVQDVASTLPVRLLGDVKDRRVADLCAAPGGKTAQLAAAGARVHAIDSARTRVSRLRDNLSRLKLRAVAECADARTWRPPYAMDAVLLDAPCAATGTIRRHPDLPFLKKADHMTALTTLQRELIDQAVAIARPGSPLIYCTCSLEPEEGPDQIAALLARFPGIAITPIDANEVPGFEAAIRPDGTLWVLPDTLAPRGDIPGGSTGFYIARLQKVQ
ncbi:MAG: transcription antitermination factor NusB [Pseudomonadota bacterium]